MAFEDASDISHGFFSFKDFDNTTVQRREVSARLKVAYFIKNFHLWCLVKAKWPPLSTQK